MKTQAKFTFDKVRHDQDNELHLVVTLEAPKLDWEKSRAPICVMPVIDTSGSMSGAPLDYAKKSAIKLIDHLSKDDYAGLVIFDSQIDLISAPLKMTSENKDSLRKKIGDLHTRGCTNFSGGLIMGLKEVQKADLPKNVIKRVIMLTDGMPNEGVATDYQSLSTLLKAEMNDVTVSCFGYGVGANQELLADLSTVGKGNYAFIQNPDDALSAFAKELGGLLSTYAQNIKVVVQSNNGHEILDMISDVTANGDNKKVTISLPEIISEEKLHIVQKVKLTKQTKALPRQMSVFDIKVTYDVMKDDKVETLTEDLVAKIRFVRPGREQEKADQELDKIVANAEIVKAQNEAEAFVTIGDYTNAQVKMKNLFNSLTTRGLDAHATYTSTLESAVSSAAAYTSNSSYWTGGKKAMTRSRSVAAVHNDTAKILEGLVDMDNSAQEQLKESFNKEDESVQTATIPPNKNISINRVRKSW